MHNKVWNASLVVYQKRVVIWANRALKSFVAVPVPSGFEAKSNALNLASSNCSACSQKRNTLCYEDKKSFKQKKKMQLQDCAKRNQGAYIFLKPQYFGHKYLNADFCNISPGNSPCFCL